MPPLPTSVNVLGVVYAVAYVDRPSDVDRNGRQARWGETDYWTRTIRIYKNERPVEDIWGTVIHEVIHAIEEPLHIKAFEGKRGHDELDILAKALADVLIRNGWLKVGAD